jgi:hypothetical protein
VKRRVPDPPAGLRKRALRLWRELHEDSERGPDESALIVEVCRLAQRLDDLDVELRGEWSVEVAREARLSAGQLRALMAELRLQETPGVARGGAVPPPQPDPGRVDEQEARRHDELAARRAQGRGADPAG